MKARIAVIALLAASGLAAPAEPPPASAAPATDRTSVIVVVGIAGSGEYGPIFSDEADRWEKISAQADAKFLAIGRKDAGPASDHDLLRQALEAEPKDGLGKLWLVLIGHGTFDGKEAKFNLRGPDLPASELALWLRPFHRPLAVIDTTSASAPFLTKLSGPDRVIITATRSGDEQNYARFGQYFIEALADPQSDLDKDGEVSLLEAFLSASARVAEFYKTEGRLATEHPLIDDNGDGLGTPPDWFEGVRAVKKARDGASVDGPLAQQFVLVPSAEEQKLSPAVRAQRDRLELAVSRLRDNKASLPADDYYSKLEALLLQLARLYPQPGANAGVKTSDLQN
ncbi:MAG: hypothetical protein ABSA05_00470 [Opitutaceae bacterium]|jgi:hypothetical protein